MDDKDITKTERNFLRELGLSPGAIELYGLLLKHGQLSAKEAGMYRQEFASAQYRLFEQLEKLGLVLKHNVRPLIFSAVPKATGLSAAYQAHHANLGRLLSALELGEGTPTKLTELIIGRQALYDRYVTLASQSKHEIWVYAIGIAYSEELHAAQSAAIKRGVSIHHVVQQVKPSNFHVVKKWQRAGVKLKFAQTERGFHVMVFDKDWVIITFSDPKNTDDRVSVLTGNRTAIELFRGYFTGIWQNAQPIEL